MTEKLIERNPDILGGTPVFSGTRIPVRILMEHLEAGDRLDDFLDDYPTVTREQAVGLLERAKAQLAGDALRGFCWTNPFRDGSRRHFPGRSERAPCSRWVRLGTRTRIRCATRQATGSTFSSRWTTGSRIGKRPGSSDPCRHHGRRPNPTGGTAPPCPGGGSHRIGRSGAADPPRCGLTEYTTVVPVREEPAGRTDRFRWRTSRLPCAVGSRR